MKGVREPVPVYELEGVGAAAHALRRLARARAHALRGARRRHGDARAGARAGARRQRPGGRGRGRGRHRQEPAVLRVRRALPRAGTRVYEGHGVAHGKNIPFLPMLEVFRAYFGIERATATARRARRSPAAAAARRELPRAAAAALRLHGRPGPASAAPPMDPGSAAAPALRRAAPRGPGATRASPVVLIEDLHWIDAGSEAFLAQWWRRCRTRSAAARELPARVPRRLDAEVLLPPAPAGAARPRCDPGPARRSARQRPEPRRPRRRDPRAHRRQPLLHRRGRAVADRGGQLEGHAAPIGW